MLNCVEVRKTNIEENEMISNFLFGNILFN